MATSTHYAVTSAVGMADDSHDGGNKNMPQKVSHTNGTANVQKNAPKFRSKYKHVAALHKVSRPSILSHDSQDVPSFLGFRNLMVLTISESKKLMIHPD